MAAGFEVFDANGATVISVTDKLCRILGSVDITSNGSTTNPGLLNGTPWWACRQISASSVDATYPNISVSGSTISWSYNEDYVGGRVPVSLVYGVY